MHRWAVLLLALLACDVPSPPREAPPPVWAYPPAPTVWPLGEIRGRLGRSQPPQPALHAGISGSVRFPLRSPTPWAVPGDGPARVVIYGFEGARPAIELIEIDAGRVAWRDLSSCPGPVVGVTDEAIVCADATGVRGVTLAGKQAWRSDAPFIAITEDRVVVGAVGEGVILEAASGQELARIRLPATVPAESILASCGDVGRELFATAADGTLVRIADVKGGAAISWSAPIGAIEDLDACSGETLLVKTPGLAGSTLVALARATGRETGRVEGVRGWWPARTGSGIEIATASGVTTWSRDLVSGEPTGLPPLGELLATRGDRRLVRATSMTAVILDPAGVRAYVELSAMGAALGDDAMVAASWSGSDGETVRRLGLPPRYPRSLRLPSGRGVALPAELRDLPDIKPVDLASTIELPDTAKQTVRAVAIDPRDSAVVYAMSLERPVSDATSAGVASVDLMKRAWTWQRNDACGPGTPIGLAIAHDVVVCAARTAPPGTATVRATTRDGKPSWEWETAAIDGVQAAGDTVIAFTAGQLFVLDAHGGRLRARLASDDGATMRAALVELENETTILVTYERGRLVARVPSIGMIPVWTLAVDGVIRGLSPSKQGVLVELEDGDAFRVDARSAEIAAVAGLGLHWRAEGDLVSGSTPGGPIPGAPIVVPSAPIRAFTRFTAHGRRLPPPSEDDPEAPSLWTPIPAPPPLGDSWQYTLYDLTGAVRARNDYAITGTVAPTQARGPAGSPLVVTYGEGRDVLILDPRTGDPLRRVALPTDAPLGVTFSTVVDGTPVAGTLLAAPLRIVLF